jgi:glyceraldehyde 3-phosphate dehydrogenase
MSIRVAINGYGRIGRALLRARYENPEKHQAIQIIAINGRGKFEINTHLTRYDTVHGKFPGKIEVDNKAVLKVNDHPIQFFNEQDPATLPWRDLQVDIVYECSGRFTTREQAQKHLLAGAKKVLISAPAKGADATIVYGVNHKILRPAHAIISNGSCTTNCLATLVKPLLDSPANIGFDKGLMTTIHAYTNDQSLVDSYHVDPYRARAAAQSIIPTQTGAAATIGQVIPALAGKLEGLAVRVPTSNVSLVDLTFQATKSTTVEEINHLLKAAAHNCQEKLLAYSEEPLVSVDFNHHIASAIVAAPQTRVINKLVKILAWYDNEWGFVNRMLDVTHHLAIQ